jgi:hypothetical protein
MWDIHMTFGTYGSFVLCHNPEEQTVLPTMDTHLHPVT